MSDGTQKEETVYAVLVNSNNPNDRGNGLVLCRRADLQKLRYAVGSYGVKVENVVNLTELFDGAEIKEIGLYPKIVPESR